MLPIRGPGPPVWGRPAWAAAETSGCCPIPEVPSSALQGPGGRYGNGAVLWRGKLARRGQRRPCAQGHTESSGLL